MSGVVNSHWYSRELWSTRIISLPPAVGTPYDTSYSILSPHIWVWLFAYTEHSKLVCTYSKRRRTRALLPMLRSYFKWIPCLLKERIGREKGDHPMKWWSERLRTLELGKAWFVVCLAEKCHYPICQYSHKYLTPPQRKPTLVQSPCAKQLILDNQ